MRRRLLAHYLAVLLDAFAVDRQVEVFLPVRYGAPVEAAVEQKTNVDLKTFYFGGAVPSLCTCLLNGSVEALSEGALSEAQLTEALGQFEALKVPILVERLLLLDKFFKATGAKAVKKEAESLCKSLFKSLFKGDPQTQGCLSDRYAVVFAHFALILSYMPAKHLDAVTRFVLAPCACLDRPDAPCYRQRLLRSASFYENAFVRDHGGCAWGASRTAMDVILQQARGPQAAHAVALLVGFPPSYWTDVQRLQAYE